MRSHLSIASVLRHEHAQAGLGDIILFLEGSQGSLFWWGSVLAVRKAS